MAVLHDNGKEHFKALFPELKDLCEREGMAPEVVLSFAFASYPSDVALFLSIHPKKVQRILKSSAASLKLGTIRDLRLVVLIRVMVPSSSPLGFNLERAS